MNRRIPDGTSVEYTPIGRRAVILGYACWSFSTGACYKIRLDTGRVVFADPTELLA